MTDKILGFTGKYFPFSNFFDNNTLQVVREGVGFSSVEAAFQAAKLDIENPKKRKTMLEVFSGLTPDGAKAFGRSVQIRADWEERKYDVMFNLVFQKFNNNHELKELLLSTGDAYLEETNNWHDNHWGNCTCPKCIGTKGDNYLGLILMKVRELLKNN